MRRYTFISLVPVPATADARALLALPPNVQNDPINARIGAYSAPSAVASDLFTRRCGGPSRPESRTAYRRRTGERRG
jgi:hypothetical protein